QDVGDFPRVEAELLDLADRRDLGAKYRAREEQEEPAETARGILDVAQPESRIDEHEAAVSLEEQAVARETRAQGERAPVHERTAKRTAGNTVQVMHANHSPTLLRP